MKKLKRPYFQNPDILFLCRDLLGKYLLTEIDGVVTGGPIIETEAYKGIEDKASHSYNNRRTKRTETLYQKGGVCYVYLIYGMYCLLNIVTGEEEVPSGILIRGIKPEIGIEKMMERRKQKVLQKTLSSGPGTLTMALGIERRHNGLTVDRPPIWLEDRGLSPKNEEVIIGPRVGIDYAEEHALLPWRYRWISILDKTTKKNK